MNEHAKIDQSHSEAMDHYDRFNLLSEALGSTLFVLQAATDALKLSGTEISNTIGGCRELQNQIKTEIDLLFEAKTARE